MLTFNDAPAITHSFDRDFTGINQGRANREFCCFLMSGAVPASFNDIPFDASNPIEIGRNCKGFSLMEMERNVTEKRFDFQNVTSIYSVNGTSQDLYRQHWFDTGRNAWRLAPSSIFREPWIDSFDPKDAAQVDDAYRDLVTFSQRCYLDSDLFTAGNSFNQSWFSGSRYPYNNPLIFEYDQVVTLDLLSMQQTHSGSIYDNTGLTIEMWDPTLNEGAGGWTNSQAITYGGGNTQNEVDLSTLGLISNKFRVSGNDTGSSGWIVKYFHFYSNTEPTVTPFDITWALIGPSYHGAVAMFNGPDFDFNTTRPDDAYALPRYPFMMVSVGNATTEGSLLLSKSTNIDGKYTVQPRILTISWA